MRIISTDKIKGAVKQLCIRANLVLRPDVLKKLQSAYVNESNRQAKSVLAAIIQNARVARRENLAICQDTGLVCVFVEIGRDVKISGDIKTAINQGVELGYRAASLRNSVIVDPLKRGKSTHVPAVIHFDSVKGNKIKLTVFPKGFGCENRTQLKMFKPTAGIEEIKEFVVNTVKSAGCDACPPYVVGVGIGGTADYACFLAKKALLNKVTKSQSHKVTRQADRLERDLLREINALNIGPMGLGGKNTVLAVNIETHPTHIAGLPVAVNISCHALRSATKVI